MPVDEVSIAERRTHLYNILANVDRVHREWTESDVPHITQEFEDAIDEMIVIFSGGDLPGDLRLVAAAVDDVKRHWEAWRSDAATTAELILPGNGFWRALQNAQAATRKSKTPPRIQLETVKELTDQKVPDAQICLIYGFVDANGHPELAKLREERETPGKHTGPGTGWVPPIERQRQAAAEAEERSRARLASRTARKQVAAPKPAESIEILAEQGVSALQIASMHGVDVAEVFARCDKAGIPRPAEGYDLSQGVHDREPNESRERQLAQMGKSPRFTDPDSDEVEAPPQTLEEEVLFYHRQGLEPAAIRDALKTEGLSLQKIKTIIKSADKPQ